MNVYDIANDLAQQIKKSEEYVNYKMAREAIKLNSKLSEEIKNFDQLRYQTQIEVMQTGKNDPEKLQKVQDKYAELIEQNDAKRYFEADRNFCGGRKDTTSFCKRRGSARYDCRGRYHEGRQQTGCQ